jgi:hypothetical protein
MQKESEMKKKTVINPAQLPQACRVLAPEHNMLQTWLLAYKMSL